MGATAHAAEKPQQLAQKSDGKFHFGNEKDAKDNNKKFQFGNQKDPKDNDKKFQYGNEKDPKDNDKKFQFGNNLDPKEASELKSIQSDIEQLKVQYKGNPMYQFFKQGAKAVTDAGGDAKAIQAAHQAFMSELSSKHMSAQVPTKAFNDGLKFGKMLLRQAELTPEK